MSQSRWLRPFPAGLTWPALRYPGEQDLRAELDRQPELLGRLRPWTEPRRIAPGLADGLVRALPAICPALDRVAQVARQILNLREELALYVFPSERWQCVLLHDPGGRAIRVALSAAMARHLLVREALFVIGRAIAKRTLGQVPLLADPSFGSESRDQATLLARGLWRFQELSADRIGLLCCQDLGIAAKTILKTSSGLTDDLLKVDLDALTSTPLDENDVMMFGDTHDFLMLRIAELNRFAKSDEYERLFAAEESPNLWAPSGAVCYPTETVGATKTEAPLSAPEPIGAEDAIAANVSEEPAPLPGPATPLAAPELESLPSLDTVAAPSAESEPPILESVKDAVPAATVDEPCELVEPFVPPVLDEIAEDLQFSVSQPDPPPGMRVFRPVPGADGLMEEVTLAPPPIPTPPSTDSLVDRALQDSLNITVEPEGMDIDANRREFVRFALAWITTMGEPLCPVKQAALESLIDAGSESELAFPPMGTPLDHANRTEELAVSLSVADTETRLGLLRDLLSVAAADGRLAAAESAAIASIGAWLGLAPSDLELVRAEFVDPEYADYHFRAGQRIEVQLDGEWVAGDVENVDDDGDLRVYFPADNLRLRLSPKADLIRPYERRAG